MCVCALSLHRRGQAVLSVKHWGEVDLKFDIHLLSNPFRYRQHQTVFREVGTASSLPLCPAFQNTLWLENSVADAAKNQENPDFLKKNMS